MAHAAHVPDLLQLAEGDLVGHARLAGATPRWRWIGEGAATGFGY